MSETPTAPMSPVFNTSVAHHYHQSQPVTKTKTKLVRTSSRVLATKENVRPAKPPPSVLKKTLKANAAKYKKPLSMQTQQPSKGRRRIVKSLGMSRRSSYDFQVPTQSQSKATKAFSMKEFVLTSCTQEDTNLAKQLTQVLPGKARVAFKVGSTTTHVICGEERRTLTMLKAILLGCWIVSKSWLLACLEAQGWVDEEPYELVTFSAAVKARRIDRETAIVTKSNLFKDIGSIYIGKNCKVPRKDLVQLIQMAGGTIVNQLKLANVILGHALIENTESDQVSEKWLLDSIQQHCPLPFTDYS